MTDLERQRRGAGKRQLALEIARRMALNNKQVDYFVPDEEARQRVLQALGDTPNIRVLTPGQRLLPIETDPELPPSLH